MSFDKQYSLKKSCYSLINRGYQCAEREGGCRNIDNVFVERKDGIFILSKKNFNYMHLFQMFPEQS